MKLQLLTVLLIVGFSASSQTFEVDVPKIMKQSDALKLFKDNTSPQKIHKDSLIEKLRVSVIGKKLNPGIYYLPQDNMPCLAPDTKDIAAIPNAWPNVQVPFKSAIPNPGLQDKPLIPQPKNPAK
jgi:hypothetical protein